MAKEYIDREDAKARLRMWITDCVLDGDNEAADRFRDCIDLLDSIPAADVVEVVRCENCIRRGTEGCAMYWDTEDCAMRYGCEYGEQHTWETDNDFCSWGERRDNA